jgi:hypothetical protein
MKQEFGYAKELSVTIKEVRIELWNERAINFKKDMLSDFISMYNSFINFSAQLALRSEDHNGLGLSKITTFLKAGYNIKSSIKLYILLESGSLLIINGSIWPRLTRTCS